MQLIKEIRRIAAEKQSAMCRLADEVWQAAELNWRETKSADATARALETEGFAVTRAAAGLATALEARYGSEGPVIGFLGEYDALDGLSQQAACPQQAPLAQGAPGHGCGHNLLGAGAFGAAVILKELVAAGLVRAQVRFFGCPAEEDGAGKAYMARAGLFRGLDAVFTWHPDAVNAVIGTRTLAVMGVEYRFAGRTAHAAAAPFAGRSALDAAELMNVGCNYLREHMIPDARLHYAYRDAGGKAPNVVPDRAALHYYIRAPHVDQMLELFERVNKVAQGAALMTETQVEWTVIDACSDYRPNKVLGDLLADCLAQLGAPDFTDADRQLAEQFRAATPAEQRIANLHNAEVFTGRPAAEYAAGLLDETVAPYLHQPGCVEMGSTDVGDASCCAPTAQCYTACMALGTGGHTWQFTAQANSSLGRAGMLRAAEALALAAARAAAEPELLRRAADELHAALPGGYLCPLPADAVPEFCAPAGETEN